MSPSEGARPERIALFGGTFDPPHVGHFVVAWDVVEALDLDRFWFVPSRIPPHKQDWSLTPGAVRAAMIEAGLEGCGAAAPPADAHPSPEPRTPPNEASSPPRLLVSRIELEREGPSYTVDTLRRVRAEHPVAELHFVMGMDQAAEFADWKEPDEIAELAGLVAVAREGLEGDGSSVEASQASHASVAPSIAGPFASRFRRVAVTRIDVSSTDVRRRVRDGRSIRYLVPDPVRRIIEAEKLYERG